MKYSVSIPNRVRCNFPLYIACKLLATHRPSEFSDCADRDRVYLPSNIVELRSSYLYFRSIPHKLKTTQTIW